MDQCSALTKVCKDDLGLGTVSSGQLQSGIKRWIDAWNLFAVPGERFNELSDATVKEYAGRYLDQGWDRDERVIKGAEKGAKVPPGKHLWVTAYGSKPSKYEYPKDAAAVLGGVETIFQILRGNTKTNNPASGYPTPTSARKGKRNNVSSDSDMTDADIPLVQARPCNDAWHRDLDQLLKKNIHTADDPLGKETAIRFVTSDDESLPGLVLGASNAKKPEGKRRTAVVKGAKNQKAKTSKSTETPTKRRKVTGRSLVRSSSNINAQKRSNGRQVPGGPDTEEGLPETTLLPLSIDTQVQQRLNEVDPGQATDAVPSVDDSVGSRTPREGTRAFSLDLGAPHNVASDRAAEPRSATLVQGDHPLSPSLSIDVHDYSVYPQGSFLSVNFWILASNRPRNKWDHWADVNLHLLTADSVFDIIGKRTGEHASKLIDVQLQTTVDEYSFQLQKGQYSRFEAMRAFMLQVIESNHRDRGYGYSSINIYLRSTAEPVSP